MTTQLLGVSDVNTANIIIKEKAMHVNSRSTRSRPRSEALKARAYQSQGQRPLRPYTSRPRPRPHKSKSSVKIENKLQNTTVVIFFLKHQQHSYWRKSEFYLRKTSASKSASDIFVLRIRRTPCKKAHSTSAELAGEHSTSSNNVCNAAW